jgi:hypothetical protein
MGAYYGKGVTSSCGLSRRAWLAATGAILGCGQFALGKDFNPDDPRDHPCLDWPPVPVGTSPEKAADMSPVEQALQQQEDNVSASRAMSMAPSGAANAIARAIRSGGPAAAPARAAYENSWNNLIGGKLLIYFLPGEVGVTQDLQDGVIDIAREWTKYANIDFDKTTEASKAHVRVGFNRTLGHYSYVGRRSREDVPNLAERTMNLALRDLNDSYNKFVILHEFGHAMGCIHEHSHPKSKAVFLENNQVIQYFIDHGLKNAETVRQNVFKRYNERDLIKFSDYDEKSIMHYFFPGWMFGDGRARPAEQNLALSPLDKKFASIVYPGRMPITDDKGESDKDESGKKEPEGPVPATLDGAASQGTIRPGKEVIFELTIPSGTGDVCIYTEGSTHVGLRLFGPDSTTAEITSNERLVHGTYDLTNEAFQTRLAAGKYRIQVVGVSPRGGGRVTLYASTKKMFSRMLKPNAIQAR